jgi:peptide/nickel transport system substrate-binding protein
MQPLLDPRRRSATRTGARFKRLSITTVAVVTALALSACGSSATGNSANSNSSSKNASDTISATSASGGSTALSGDSTAAGHIAAQVLGQPASGSSKPTDGGTIEVAWQQEPPCLYGEWVQIGYLSQQYLEELVASGPDGTVKPMLATSWKVSSNGDTYTFQLRKGVKFSNGAPLTAAAVVDNFKSWFVPNPATYNGYAESEIGDFYKNAVATGPDTVEVNLKSPYSDLLSVLSQYALGIQAPQAIAEGATKDCQDPIGTGPFEVVKWNHGVDVVLKKNPNYWQKGLPYVNGIDWKFVDDDTTRYASLQSGENDVVYNVPAPEWTNALQSYQVLRYNTGGTPFRFVLASKWPPFNNVLVRKAFGYAMNRSTAVQTAYLGSRVYEPNGAVGASTPDYDASLADAYTYNPTEANKLLDQAGYTKRNAQGVRVNKSGQALTIKLVYGLNMNATQDDVNFFQIIQQQVKKVGFNVVLVPVPQATFFSSGAGWPGIAKQWDILPWYWVGRTPDNLHVIWAPTIGNQVNVNNPSGDFPVSNQIAQLVASPSATTQQKLSDQIQQTVYANDALVFGITPLEVNLAITPKLHGVWQRSDVGEPVFTTAYFAK